MTKVFVSFQVIVVASLFIGVWVCDECNTVCHQTDKQCPRSQS